MYLKIVKQTITVQDFAFTTDFFTEIFSLGSTKLQNSLHLSITLILVDVHNFIYNLVTAKSSEEAFWSVK